jgi:hypothetical protein
MESFKSLRTYTPSLSIKQLREVLKESRYEEGKIYNWKIKPHGDN